MANPSNSSKCLLTAKNIRDQEEKRFVHPLNPKAVRHGKSLGDLTGLQNIGVHQVRLEPGDESTQYHFHYQEEEFVYILSGKGTLEVGDESYEVGPGDFMGFPAPSPPHVMTNTFEVDLVYLMGGQRLPYDVTDYPRIKKRLYRQDGEKKLVDFDQLKSFS